jgi:hypothetical protein
VFTIYFYKAYGLGIKSSIEFPELLSGNADLNVIIQFQSTESTLLEVPEEKNHNIASDKSSNLDIPFFWDNEFIFRVINGKKIIVNPKTSLNLVFLRALILGQGLGIILHQRGYLVLHGSAVNMNQGAVAFLGPCGYGKSTTTLALNKRGYPLIADDVLAVKLDGNTPMIFPSFSGIKVFEDVIEHITDYPNSFTKIHPDVQKYLYNPKKSFSLDPVSLKMIYILEKDGRNEISSSLRSQEKLIGLIKNTYPKPLFGSAEKTHNLFQCKNLLEKVPVKRLSILHSFKKLEEVMRTVEKDVLMS